MFPPGLEPKANCSNGKNQSVTFGMPSQVAPWAHLQAQGNVRGYNIAAFPENGLYPMEQSAVNPYKNAKFQYHFFSNKKSGFYIQTSDYLCSHAEFLRL